MIFIKKLISHIKNPMKIVNYFGSRGRFRFIPDRLYLKIIYCARMGRKLNLDNPLTYSEKLQWLKLYDRNSEYIKLVDKFEVRSYIKKTIGEQYLIPLIGVYDSFDEINFNELPNQFILKCTHDSGGKVICKDKATFDIESARRKMKKYLKRNYYYPGREWPYKHIKPRIICEEYMVDESGTGLKDYKFFCFHGEPKFLFVATDRENDIRLDYFDMNFKQLDFTQEDKRSEGVIHKPAGFDKMVELSRILSKDIPQVRVDFYDIYGRVYFGEITFYHNSGFGKFQPEIQDEILGSWINLPFQKQGE